MKPIHRLIDMLVSEISLVDKAANKRRFLIIKRSCDMPAPNESTEQNLEEQETENAIEDEQTEESQEAETSEEQKPKKDEEENADLKAALENLKNAVESLANLPETSAQNKLHKLAAELSGIGKALSDAMSFSADPMPQLDVSEKPFSSDELVKARESLEQVTDTLKALVTPLAGLLGGVTHATTKRIETPSKSAPKSTTEPSTSELIKQLSARLARIEKNVGLPASRPVGERPGPQDPEVVWSYDLNNEPTST